MADQGKAPDELPSGYRQAIVTAVSIFLTFSLLFLRYWSFEANGDWTVVSLIAALMMVAAVLLLIGTLWRALQVRDSVIAEYEKTLRWLFASIACMMASVIVAAIAYAGISH